MASQCPGKKMATTSHDAVSSDKRTTSHATVSSDKRTSHTAVSSDKRTDVKACPQCPYVGGRLERHSQVWSLYAPWLRAPSWSVPTHAYGRTAFTFVLCTHAISWKTAVFIATTTTTPHHYSPAPQLFPCTRVEVYSHESVSITLPCFFVCALLTPTECGRPFSSSTPVSGNCTHHCKR